MARGTWFPYRQLNDTSRQQTVYNFRVAESPPDSIAPAAARKSSPMTSRPYTDPANLFTLDLPAEWRLERPEQGPIRMACLAPESVQGFTANVNAGVHPLAPLTTDEYVTLCRLQLRQLSGQRELAVDTPAQRDSPAPATRETRRLVGQLFRRAEWGWSESFSCPSNPTTSNFRPA